MYDYYPVTTDTCSRGHALVRVSLRVKHRKGAAALRSSAFAQAVPEFFRRDVMLRRVMPGKAALACGVAED